MRALLDVNVLIALLDSEVDKGIQPQILVEEYVHDCRAVEI